MTPKTLPGQWQKKKIWEGPDGEFEGTRRDFTETLRIRAGGGLFDEGSGLVFSVHGKDSKIIHAAYRPEVIIRLVRVPELDYEDQLDDKGFIVESDQHSPDRINAMKENK